MKKLMGIVLSAAVALPAGAWSAEIVVNPLPGAVVSMTGSPVAGGFAPVFTPLGPDAAALARPAALTVVSPALFMAPSEASPALPAAAAAAPD
ncbi:MAG: hypothetical protein ACHQ2Z_08065, partial [Elusimicrobiota bacterium]